MALIQTPEEFKKAIQEFRVEEVSPELFGTLTDAFFGTLTSPIKKYSWTSRSANLYQFLVLNQRYQNRLTPADSRYFQDTDPISLEGVRVDAIVSEEAMNGLSRIVGVPGSVKDWKAFGADDYNPANAVYSYNSQLVVYKEKAEKQGVLGGPALPEMPTWRDLIRIVNGHKPDDQAILEIPEDVIIRFEEAYSETSKGKSTPVEVFSSLTGINTASSLSFDTQLKKVNKNEATGIKTLDLDPGVGISDATRAAVVEEVFDVLKPHVDDNINFNQPYGSGTREYSARFFQNFANKYNYKSESDLNALSEDFEGLTNLEVLTIGVRIFLDQAYGASPYFTGFGFGYMLGQNPLAGRRTPLQLDPGVNLDRGVYENFTDEEKLRESFTGQEYFVNNIQWWSVTGANAQNYHYGMGGEENGVSQNVDVQVFGSKVNRGVNLRNPEAIKNGHFDYVNMRLQNVGDSPYNKFTRGWHGTSGEASANYNMRYVVTSDNVLFTTSPEADFTSDVIDATEIKFFELDNSFHKDYELVDHNNQKLVAQDTMLYSVLPELDSVVNETGRYAFVSRSSGGIDRVYGSEFNDIITGSPAGTTSGGQMHVEAGGGDDIINTGRGASLIYTGTGNDRIFVESDELFGDSIIMDFLSSKDKIYIPKTLQSQVSYNMNTLSISDASNGYDTKVFKLSGESFPGFWSDSDIVYV